MSRLALITGATSGIGRATALLLAEKGINLIITGRREDRLLSLKKELEMNHIQVLTLCFDVRDKPSVKEMLGNLPAAWSKIDVLVNNAGLAAGLGTVQNGNMDDWERMIDTNVKGLLYVTRAVAPGMVERNSGHIINIGSIAGKEVYPNGNVYCATKHAVDALTKGMRIDMLPHNIKVTQICPGAVETEFSLIRFHGDKARADKVYEGYENLVAEDIADCIWFVISRPPHVNINDMVVMPTAQASATIFHKV
ncbi:MAG: NAD(P)-dependent oxidoreductase [Bacteroidetes bacterium GWD2_45_23]|nr:MAG: NAD(P)-dependent oxidoreductase [Bacteroidetes bacterium GWC2_46_850]OFX65844.1 MAG: NAD(P)-dependent oxidoreductase [Bacteroidetes bacterium GWC1_47_7]OFX83924.1 MAG: NAD(P)-dependent oxidoreductase [Bacteroidetes bacterium GWD2_45_23]HAR39416.1 NAD(P)-dependent oxidoreductase [Porphyromonadaceae bacterium]HBB00631.1 NAD(P)-dependent oxidoreductase [Porphyromonadaceae bacterium]